MLDTLNTYLLFPSNTSDTAELSRVLEIVEGEAVAAPTHASRDERKRLPYDRSSCIAARANRGRSAGFNLWRGKVPKYSDGFLSANDSAYNRIMADYGPGLSERHLPEIFATWTRLAEKLRPEFGLVHCRWALGAASERYNYGFRINAKELRERGFCSLHARTWFGPDLVSVIGMDRLLTIEHTKKTSWGGAQLDLVENPWLADFETLARRQREVVQIFAGWGLMADYSNPSNIIPGPNWTPRHWDL